MLGKTMKLFTMFGFAVRIDTSWLLILALVVWSLSVGVFPVEYEGLQWPAYLAMGLTAALGLFASIVVHELCHSLVARRYGLPMKGITLFFFGGVAEMSDEPPSPKAELLMALAGPAASLVIAGVFIGLWALGRAVAWPDPVTAVMKWIGFINGILVAFNLVPGFPLDGGRVLRAILWHFRHDLRRATRAASRVGSGVGTVLIILGVLNLFFSSFIGGLWWILIGIFLKGAARQGYQQVLIRQALAGEKVRRFMSGEPVTVPADTTLERLVDDYVYQHHYKMFPVQDDGRLAGCVTTRGIKDVPREEWNRRTARDVAEPCTEENTVDADEDAMKALTLMSKNQSSRLLVVENDRLVGVITLKDLLRFLSLKLELEGDQPPRPLSSSAPPVDPG